MAARQKKRQKKLESRAAQRKQRHKSLTKHKHRGQAARLAEAARSPVLDACISETVGEAGLGGVLISRELPNGYVAFGHFLVDCSCLGVKDAFGKIVSRAEYNRFVDDIESHYPLVRSTPEDVRNLVEQAVQFARDLGLEPHADYDRVAPIFGDIDPSEATDHFEFGGMDGKPHFVSGPNETPERCRQILSILEHSCGKDGFTFTIPYIVDIPEALRSGIRVISSDGEELTERVDDDEEDDEDDDGW